MRLIATILSICVAIFAFTSFLSSFGVLCDGTVPQTKENSDDKTVSAISPKLIESLAG